MRALTIVGDHLAVAERQVDKPVAAQLVVEVAGAGINRGDLWQAAGRYPAPPGVPADIPGLEFARTARPAGPLAPPLRHRARLLALAPGAPKPALPLLSAHPPAR